MFFIEEAIISGLISKIVNDSVDITKERIKQAIQNKKNKHQTFESQIYNVTVDTLNDFVCSEYKREEEKIYDAAESMLIGFQKRGYENIEDVVRDALNHVCTCVNSDKCQEFLGLLCHEINQEKYNQLYHKIRLIQEKEESRKTTRIEQKIDSIDQKIERGFNKVITGTTDKNRENECFKTEGSNKFEKDSKEDYIEKWNSRLFLHPEEGEKTVTLADTFIMPDYVLYKGYCKMDFWSETKLNKVIDKFINYKKNTNLLIMGSPGIGKSSIVSWIANRYKEDNNIIILRFRDWECEELHNGILKAILGKLKCKKEDLENRTLVLDGFDEMKSVNGRNNLLDRFLSDILDCKNFKVIITSRPNYLDIGDFRNAISLFPFNTKKICEFYNIITGDELDAYIIDNSVIGIPVILYMAIMSGIDITENATKPELFNRIFAEEGGIFDKFSYDGSGYDIGAHPLRLKRNVKIYLRFLRSLAIDMFKKDELELKKENCHIPKISFQDGYLDILEFPIKHLFESIELKIEFIHKSIYDYFVSEYIFALLDKSIEFPKEQLASSLGDLFKENRLSNEIIEFLNYKFKTKRDLNKLSSFVYETFQLMINKGMMFYTGRCYENVIKCEICVFANMLDILHLLDNVSLELNEFLCNYIKLNRNGRLNLSFFSVDINNRSTINLKGVYLAKSNLSNCNLQGVDLGGADLKSAHLTGTNLSEANLRGADLRGADLRGTDLTRTNLRGADLKGADLTETNLNKANLSGADLKGADLTETNLNEANLSGADLKGAHITETNLNEANLSGADLSDIILKKVIMTKVKLNDAKLEKTEFHEVDMRGTDLKNLNKKKLSLRRSVVDESQPLYLKQNKWKLKKVDVNIGNSEETIRYEKYCIRETKRQIADFIKKSNLKEN